MPAPKLPLAWSSAWPHGSRGSPAGRPPDASDAGGVVPPGVLAPSAFMRASAWWVASAALGAWLGAGVDLAARTMSQNAGTHDSPCYNRAMVRKHTTRSAG